MSCQEEVDTMARQMFQKMEVGDDGELNIEQFVQACLTNEEVVFLLRGDEVQDE